MKLLFSDRALNDLGQIGDYISKDAPETARKHVQKLIDRTKQAIQHPKLGRIVPEYQEEKLREFIEGNYRIVYEIDEKKSAIIVVTIFESHLLISDDLIARKV